MGAARAMSRGTAALGSHCDRRHDRGDHSRTFRLRLTGLLRPTGRLARIRRATVRVAPDRIELHGCRRDAIQKGRLGSNPMTTSFTRCSWSKGAVCGCMNHAKSPGWSHGPGSFGGEHQPASPRPLSMSSRGPNSLRRTCSTFAIGSSPWVRRSVAPRPPPARSPCSVEPFLKVSSSHDPRCAQTRTLSCLQQCRVALRWSKQAYTRDR